MHYRGLMWGLIWSTWLCKTVCCCCWDSDTELDEFCCCSCLDACLHVYGCPCSCSCCRGETCQNPLMCICVGVEWFFLHCLTCETKMGFFSSEGEADRHTMFALRRRFSYCLHVVGHFLFPCFFSSPDWNTVKQKIETAQKKLKEGDEAIIHDADYLKSTFFCCGLAGRKDTVDSPL